ncbi:MAG: hypothetical protein LBR13_03320 [Dysgonamonadaceae bacterium]|nr:hypothetical protein [Dysgonamonadaceae bacterium]
MSNKPYNLTDNTTESVAEPAVAYNAVHLGIVEKFDLRSCSTLAELKAELRQSVKDASNGLGITLEQARARHPRL